jgi:peptide/nickel transport system substrate-binding protein
MMRRSVLITCAFLILLSLSACKSTPPTSGVAPTQAESQPVPTTASVVQATEAPAPEATTEPTAETRRTVGENTATIAFNQEFDSFNPLFAQAVSAQMVYDIWNCRAWTFDDQNNALPILVGEIPSLQNGGISQDGREITLKLQDDIAWSDGQPITSQDFLFTYQMIMDPNNNILNKTPYDLVENVTAPDPKTVVVRFNEPNASWLYSLWPVILPSHVLEPVFTQAGSIQNADWNLAPTVGCGPYVFEEWERGTSVTFKTNENYWLDFPKLGKIIIQFFPNDAAKAQAIIAGKADISIFLIDGAQQVPLMRDAGMQILPVDSGYKEGIFFFLDPTNGHPALQDPRVRQAIAIAIDRNTIIRDEYADAVKPAISYWDGTPYIDPSLQPWPFDPEKARSLLDEAGWVDSNGNGIRDKDGTELDLTYGTTTSEVRQAVQAAMQKQLSDVGVQVELLNYDADTFFAAAEGGGPAAGGQLDLFEYSVRTSNYPDPGTSDFLCDRIPSESVTDGENWSYLCDPDLDELFKKQATQIDFSQRQKTVQEISKMIYDKVYFVGLWTDPDYWAANPRLKNVKLSGKTPFYNIAEWDIQQ